MLSLFNLRKENLNNLEVKERVKVRKNWKTLHRISRRISLQMRSISLVTLVLFVMMIILLRIIFIEQKSIDF